MEQQVGASIAAAAFAPESTVHVPLQLADVSEEQRLLEKFGLTDLTAKAIKMMNTFLPSFHGIPIRSSTTHTCQRRLKCASFKLGQMFIGKLREWLKECLGSITFVGQA